MKNVFIKLLLSWRSKGEVIRLYVSLEPESMNEVIISTELDAVKITVCIGEGNPITWVLSLSGTLLDEVLLQLLLSRETAKRFF